MKIAIASDHGGFELKEKIYKYLLDKNYNVINYVNAKGKKYLKITIS